ncbi:MAG: GYD domain-containing protein [Candidatus Hodarchaeota archaeon]
MIFITLVKSKGKPTKEATAGGSKLFAKVAEECGVKFLGIYWTLGRYDGVSIAEALDEKSYMKAILRFGDMGSTETLVAVKREDALKLLE